MVKLSENITKENLKILEILPIVQMLRSRRRSICRFPDLLFMPDMEQSAQAAKSHSRERSQVPAQFSCSDPTFLLFVLNQEHLTLTTLIYEEQD